MKTVTNLLYAVFALVCVAFVRNAQAGNPTTASRLPVLKPFTQSPQ